MAGGVSVDCKSSVSSGQAAFMYAQLVHSCNTRIKRSMLSDVISVCHPAKEKLTTTGNLMFIMTSFANYALLFETCLFVVGKFLVIYHCLFHQHAALRNNRNHVHARGNLESACSCFHFRPFFLPKLQPLRLRLLLLPVRSQYAGGS